MLSSLPVRRRTIVVARYLSSVLWVLIAAVAWLTSGRLLVPILSQPWESGMGPTWATLPGVLSFVVVATVVLNLFLPLYFRLGFGRALIAFVGLSLLSLGASAVVLGLVPLATNLEGWFLGLIQEVGSGWVLAGVLATLALVVAATGTASVAGFRSRDL